MNIIFLHRCVISNLKSCVQLHALQLLCTKDVTTTTTFKYKCYNYNFCVQDMLQLHLLRIRDVTTTTFKYKLHLLPLPTDYQGNTSAGKIPQ